MIDRLAVLVCITLSLEIVKCDSETLEFNTTTKCKCGKVYEEAVADVSSLTQLIIEGLKIPKKAHPFLALLRSRRRLVCGGTVISNRYVLTAAHCFNKRIATSSIEVVLGTHKILWIGKHAKIFSISEKIVHEGYKENDRQGLENDIALLRLNETVEYSKYIQPICLPTGVRLKGRESVRVQGWGSTKVDGMENSVPLEALLVLLTPTECQESRLGPLMDDPLNHLCATDMYADSCTGDSGGPLFLTENLTRTQVGVVSFGSSCGQLGYPGVYTNVSYFLPWIQEHTRDSEFCANPSDPTPRTPPSRWSRPPTLTRPLSTISESLDRLDNLYRTHWNHVDYYPTGIL